MVEEADGIAATDAFEVVRDIAPRVQPIAEETGSAVTSPHAVRVRSDARHP